MRCWIAPRDIVAGIDYGKAIIGAIKQATVMVLIFTESSNASNHVRNEVERAFNNGLPIITFRIADVVPTDSLEYFLSRTQWLDAIDGKVEAYFDDLLSNSIALLKAQNTSDTDQAAQKTGQRVLHIVAKRNLTFWDQTLADLGGDTFTRKSQRLIREGVR